MSRKGVVEFGLSEFILLLLALLFGGIIFYYVMKTGGFFDRIEDMGCTLANNVISVVRAFGMDMKVC